MGRQWVADKDVIDVACGTGYGSAIIKQAGAKSVTSIDLFEEALRFGIDKYAIRALRCDAHVLPLRSSCADAVISLETIEHLADPRTFLEGVRRVLRRAGTFVVTTPNLDASARANPHHLVEYSREELEDVLRSTGFSVADRWGQGWLTPLQRLLPISMPRESPKSDGVHPTLGRCPSRHAGSTSIRSATLCSVPQQAPCAGQILYPWWALARKIG